MTYHWKIRRRDSSRNNAQPTDTTTDIRRHGNQNRNKGSRATGKGPRCFPAMIQEDQVLEEETQMTLEMENQENR